ncbi:Fe-S cluster assembly protein IscX [Streptomyces griseocarneus]|uniref:Fe-S cluster assembly protein IscX n=1 Tax=Streptomyces griseocarneus TaxID=51201 RepID=UPI00167C7115|nr:Fe-S cluster assembly protein IscX [Streptomyces griseocarneus]MBZ6474312.1 Fe-S cluster assembly protein IscX [Streptomyces griseocarneus]
MRWTDIEQIAADLAARHPGTKPLTVKPTEIRDRVAALSGFTDDPTLCNPRILESIQLAWSDRAR